MIWFTICIFFICDDWDWPQDLWFIPVFLYYIFSSVKTGIFLDEIQHENQMLHVSVKVPLHSYSKYEEPILLLFPIIFRMLIIISVLKYTFTSFKSKHNPGK